MNILTNSTDLLRRPRDWWEARTLITACPLLCNLIYTSKHQQHPNKHNIFQDWCPDSGALKRWRPLPISRSQVQEMRVTVGLLMPPWDRKMFLKIFVHPNVPLPVTRDFVALLQKNSPGLCQITESMIGLQIVLACISTVLFSFQQTSAKVCNI